MNKPSYINIYQTISPNKFYAYSKWIPEICFGIKLGSNEQSSFISNHINGHFSYNVNPKYYPISATPQTEQEAKKYLYKAINEFNSKLSNVSKNNSAFPKDFPSLFNNNHISLKGIEPTYNEQCTHIISWRALFGIELKTFSSSSPYENKSNKTTLEGESIIIEISGNKIVVLNYNHTPIIKRKESLIIPDENSYFIYKKINQNTIAPYYLTSRGYIPACKDSVALLTQPVSYGWLNPISTEKGLCKSRITLSNIIQPSNDLPGSAKIVISMDYRIITLGEGAVDNISIINSEEFSKLFRLGNAPGEYNNFLKVKSLPTNESIAILLTKEEERLSKKLDKTTRKPIFNNYYKVQIEYQFNLDTTSNLNLWEGIKWLIKCPHSRGLISLLPFDKAVENWYHYNNTLTLDDIKNEIKEEKDYYNEEDIHTIFILTKKESILPLRAEIYMFFLKNIIADNTAKYSNSNLFISTKSRGFLDNKFIFSNQEFILFLSSIGSSLYLDKLDDNSKPWKEIEELDQYINEKLPIFIEHLITDSIKRFKKLKAQIAATSIIGATPEGNNVDIKQNIIILNHLLFGKSSINKKFYFGGMTPTEVLVHEVGHNLASSFVHKYTTKELAEGANDGTYEYNQVGLQSNENKKIYPTLLDNTIQIINDTFNRKNMTIL
ncbi:MAG: hypothetical protein QM212_02530 [Bacteroidota bacterium]|jgi:hypothetical protein|nr:hypothetical protein [Bacteroidales bacterium]MDI9534841.1 hypothetical protein [Bacteroidota bacterium]OQC45649.1 MAG: hypothetical protein BWX59_01055 [Bacteroidetes bacterium ADurb.Bin028]MCK9256062.1 hypothetical protein [Bacteroidales bacterium]MCK9499940.1 hypothetical protein [Bacteroidales bacterium]